jgi:hypothetical protein
MKIYLIGTDGAGKNYFMFTLACLCNLPLSSFLTKEKMQIINKNLINGLSLKIDNIYKKIDSLYIQNSILRYKQTINPELIKSWKTDNTKHLSFAFNYKNVLLEFINLPEELFISETEENRNNILTSYFNVSDKTGLLFFIDGAAFLCNRNDQIQTISNVTFSNYDLKKQLEKIEKIFSYIVEYTTQLPELFLNKTAYAIVFSKSDAYNELRLEDVLEELNSINEMKSFIINNRCYFPNFQFFKCSTYGALSVRRQMKGSTLDGVESILQFLNNRYLESQNGK